MSMDRIFQNNPGSREGTGIGKRYGVDVAKVTNIKDPDKLNRVKCKRLTTDKDVGETDWMYVMSPLAGEQYGAFWMPKVGDVVILSYLGGDPHRPFVLGSLWTKGVTSPYKVENGKNETFSFKLPSGTEVVFSEVKGKESITVTAAGGSHMDIDGDKQKIVVSDKDGKNSLTFNLKSGAVEVKAEKKLTLAAGSGASIILDGNGGKCTIKTNTAIEMKSAQLKGEFNGAAQLKANGQLTLQSSGITQVKGSMLKLN